VPFGYVGSKLEVNLTSKTVRKEPLESELTRHFLGGAGFGIKILFDGVKPKTDPFSAENIVIFATGPVVGTLVPGSGRAIIISKSPLTGGCFRSLFGGYWGGELKYAGYDLIVITGSSEKPVYLSIDDDRVGFKDASHLCGKGTFETQNLIKEELGDESFQIACIGPAGENKVRIASVVHAYTHVAGRGGLGAVLGSKKLKAIAVRGSKKVDVADIDGLIKFYNNIIDETREANFQLMAYGTMRGIQTWNKDGVCPTRNYQTEVFDGWDKITGETIVPKYSIKSKGCSACTTSCHKILKITDGKYAGVISRTELEDLYALGSMTEVDDIGAILMANRLCDDLGLDGISAGVTIAFAMECYEKGILTSEDTDGLELKFGNGDTLVDCVRNMAYRKGLGNLLAEGTLRMSEALGRGSQRFAMHTKGLEFAGVSPRTGAGKSLDYAVANRGGSHMEARTQMWETGSQTLEERFSTKDKASIVLASQNLCTVEDSLITCRFFTIIYGRTLGKSHLEMIKLTTGVDIDLPQLNKIADRIYTLERCFLVREGMTRKNDTLPYRILHEPIPEGPSKGGYTKPNMLNEMLDEYYKLREWDVKTGVPTKERLKELEIESFTLTGNTEHTKKEEA